MGQIPADWLTTHLAAAFSPVESHQGWLDLRAPEVHQLLRRAMAQTLHDLGYVDFDMSDILSRNRRLTQAIARWAFEHAYGGLLYSSRFDARLDLWAIFEGATFSDVTIAPIAKDDPDLLAVARLFALTFAP